MIFEKNTRLIMIGDSITDCGRNYEATPAGWGSYGEGYVQLVNACLTGLAPEKEIMVVNKGVSGNTVVDLEKRWQKDVLDLNPDWVSIMIGVNDVWRYFDTTLQQIQLVDKETFEKVYEKLICETKPLVKGMILLSPFMIEENVNHPMRVMLQEYTQIVKALAEKYDLIYVDVQSKMDTFLQSLSSYIISADRVHPNIQGHMIIAKAFLDSIGFEWTK